MTQWLGKIFMKTLKTFHVYIMMSKSNSVNYTGVTNDLERRVWEHKYSYNENSFTSRYNINKLVYFEEYNDINSAIAREKQIKGMSRQKKFDLIKGINSELDDLAKDWFNDKTVIKPSIKDENKSPK